jgi:hypothetical protein
MANTIQEMIIDFGVATQCLGELMSQYKQYLSGKLILESMLFSPQTYKQKMWVTFFV